MTIQIENVITITLSKPQNSIPWSIVQKDVKKLKEWEMVAFLLKSKDMIRPYTASNAYTILGGNLPDYKNKSAILLQ